MVRVILTSNCCEKMESTTKIDTQWEFQTNNGVAMGSSIGPLLANIFMSKYDKELGSFSPFYYRYMDDILRTVIIGGNDYLLDYANTFHPNLKFTLETLKSDKSIS